MAQIVAARVVPRAAGDDGLLNGVLGAHVQVAARTANVDDGRAAHFDVDVALGLRVLNGVVRLE